MPSFADVCDGQAKAELTGFLLHVSLTLRPETFFVGRLLAAVGMHLSAVFPYGVANSNRRVTLGPIFDDDLNFWRWFLHGGLDSQWGLFYCPIYNIVVRPPQLTVNSHDSNGAVQ